MAMEVLHNSSNMCICDLPDMYALSPWALGIHIMQTPHVHVTTITYNTFTPQIKGPVYATYHKQQNIQGRKLLGFVGSTHNVRKLLQFATKNKLQLPSCDKKCRLYLKISREHFCGILKIHKKCESFSLPQKFFIYSI